MMAASATLRIRNQKNGWKHLCIHQEANGDSYFCAVRALAGDIFIFVITARRGRRHRVRTCLSAYCVEARKYNVKDQDMRANIELGALALDYLEKRQLPCVLTRICYGVAEKCIGDGRLLRPPNI